VSSKAKFHESKSRNSSFLRLTNNMSNQNEQAEPARPMIPSLTKTLAVPLLHSFNIVTSVSESLNDEFVRLFVCLLVCLFVCLFIYLMPNARHHYSDYY